MIKHFTISFLVIGVSSAETALSIYNRHLAVVERPFLSNPPQVIQPSPVKLGEGFESVETV